MNEKNMFSQILYEGKRILVSFSSITKKDNKRRGVHVLSLSQWWLKSVLFSNSYIFVCYFIHHDSQGDYRRTASDKFPGSLVVFVVSPDRLSGILFCQPLLLRIDKSRFSVNST